MTNSFPRSDLVFSFDATKIHTNVINNKRKIDPGLTVSLSGRAVEASRIKQRFLLEKETFSAQMKYALLIIKIVLPSWSFG